MTKLLEEAFAAAARLSPPAQDTLAAAILAEVEAEPLWLASFEGSATTLEQLATEALKEHQAGRTEPLDPNAL